MIRDFFDFWENNASSSVDRFNTKLPATLVLTGFFVFIAGLIILEALPPSSRDSAELLYVCLLLLLFGSAYFLANSLELTHTRLICKALGFRRYGPKERIVFEIACTDIAEIRVRQNGLQKILNVGTLVLILRPSADYPHSRYIRNIDKPLQVAKVLCKRSNACREKWWT